MPTLSMFYGIIIRMYNEKGGKHNVPHIHAVYQGEEAVISLENVLLEGNLPTSKLRLVTAWIEIHKEELYANWTLLSAGEKYFRIDPLK